VTILEQNHPNFFKHGLMSKNLQIPFAPWKSRNGISLYSSGISLLLRYFELSVVNLVDDVMRRFAVDGAADGLSGAQDLLDGAFQLTSHGSLLHDAGNVDDFFEWNISAVLDVLDLLAVTRRFLESADEKSRGAGNDADGSLTVLDRQLDGDAETFPVLGGFGDVITDLLGRKTEWSNLRSKGGSGSDFTTDGTKADNLDFSGIELGRHFVDSWKRRISQKSYT